jgi:hypothetical protein
MASGRLAITALLLIIVVALWSEIHRRHALVDREAVPRGSVNIDGRRETASD